jgi:hypothetical protein
MVVQSGQELGAAAARKVAFSKPAVRGNCVLP